MASDPEPHLRSLNALENAEHACRRCTLYKTATQVVPGKGPHRARIMLIGEQPGNEEDLAGAPFVGPAGHLLDEALVEAGLERSAIFVTNAVKHFKFVPRGKRRLHQRPNTEEIAACRVWNRIERDLIKPDLIVALGGTAVRSLLERTTSISSIRGKIVELPLGGKMLATIHPSYLLRIREAADKSRERRRFVADLRKARAIIEKTA